jgi:hypothetical protein
MKKARESVLFSTKSVLPDGYKRFAAEPRYAAGPQARPHLRQRSSHPFTTDRVYGIIKT